MRKFFKILGISITIILAVLVILILSFYKSDIQQSENHEKYFTTQSEYIEIDSNRLHVRIMGKGAPVLLIHGSFSSLHTWEIWQENLKNNFTTISVDLPGHGLTGPNPQGQYDTDYYAQILWQLIDKLDYDTIAIAGNSMGGQVAYKMALDIPQKVRQLILLNASGASMKADTADFKDENSFSVFSLLNHPVFSRLMTSMTPKFLFTMSMKQVYSDESKVTDHKIQRYYDLMLQTGNRQATLLRFKQRTPARFNELSSLRCPVLIMWGEHDNWIPVAHAYRFDRILPNSKLKVYPNAGHVPMEEIPLETASDAFSFLKEHY
ncbi:Pimeloyl-ACP methyl ester carboxylesterase [Marivirga sericea]|uniref:Pimeloyl-ACP methyl ester carboxylesterase n=1 Tax=Marivirga sericea TaxID=1028 RepID=A0A1X7IDL4_9BACT|nr:alpha/beta hydrolase [Marivirga sericea]SMG12726.1 Pimeloyl-ACP methyl ester carboxylesterase [Marivirga sericea]